MKRSSLFILLLLIIVSVSCKEKNKDGVAKIDYYEINNDLLYPVLDTLVIMEKQGYSKLINVEYFDTLKEFQFCIYENTPIFNQDHINLKGVFEYKGFIFYFFDNFDNIDNWLKNTGTKKDYRYKHLTEWFAGDLDYYNFTFKKDKFVLTEFKHHDIFSEDQEALE